MADYDSRIPHLLEDRPSFEDQHADAFNKEIGHHVTSRSESNTGSNSHEGIVHESTDETIEIRFEGSGGNYEVGGSLREESNMDIEARFKEEVMQSGTEVGDMVEEDADGQQQVVSGGEMAGNFQPQSIDGSGQPSQVLVDPHEQEAYIFTCPFCFERYKDAEDLKIHLPTHMGMKITGAESKEKSKEDHQCGECEKAFDSYELLRTHLQVHKNKTEEYKLFKCDICGKQFRTRYGLSNHANVHKLDEYRCNKCKQYFMDEESLVTHTLEHTKVKQEQVEDSHVDTMESVDRLDAMKLDQVVHESANLPDVDNKDNNNKNQRGGTAKQVDEVSQNDVDLKTYKYKCQFCGKLFKKKVLHTIHLRTHTGEKPYACKYCPKAFARKYVLTYHERIHSGEKTSSVYAMR
ncbi:uncharacterized protein [Amphiura filiformis]|uniref:uncharacterized protein n=1 Tax=Amphiura filiformis TaxID=82378 RepID=UPI003B21E453